MGKATTEELILTAFDEGRMETCFRLILSEYKEQMYWHIRKIVHSHDEADDAVQTTFIKTWQNLSKFNRDSKLSTWLYRIATNEALQLLRKRKPNVPIDDMILSQIEKSASSIDELDGEEIEKKLNQAILQLPNKQRLVFNMKYFDEMKYQEISEILETSVGALKASYHIAVKKIEEFLNEN